MPVALGDAVAGVEDGAAAGLCNGGEVGAGGADDGGGVVDGAGGAETVGVRRRPAKPVVVDVVDAGAAAGALRGVAGAADAEVGKDEVDVATGDDKKSVVNCSGDSNICP